MKRNKVRKGIVVLALAAASAVSVIGHGATSQAVNTPAGVKGPTAFPGKHAACRLVDAEIRLRTGQLNV